MLDVTTRPLINRSVSFRRSMKKNAMRSGVIAQKLGMTRIYTDAGERPVTVLHLDNSNKSPIGRWLRRGQAAVAVRRQGPVEPGTGGGFRRRTVGQACCRCAIGAAVRWFGWNGEGPEDWTSPRRVCWCWLRRARMERNEDGVRANRCGPPGVPRRRGRLILVGDRLQPRATAGLWTNGGHGAPENTAGRCKVPAVPINGTRKGRSGGTRWKADEQRPRTGLTGTSNGGRSASVAAVKRRPANRWLSEDRVPAENNTTKGAATTTFCSHSSRADVGARGHYGLTLLRGTL